MVIILLSKKAEKELFLITNWEKGMVFIYKLVKPRPRTKYTIKFLRLFKPLCSPDLLKALLLWHKLILVVLYYILQIAFGVLRIRVKRMGSWYLGVNTDIAA